MFCLELQGLCFIFPVFGKCVHLFQEFYFWDKHFSYLIYLNKLKEKKKSNSFTDFFDPDSQNAKRLEAVWSLIFPSTRTKQ